MTLTELSTYLTLVVSTTTIDVNINLNVPDGTNVNAGASTSTASTVIIPQQAFPSNNSHGFNQIQEASRGPAPQVPPVVEPAIELSQEQKEVLKLVKSGKNIFFTGPAGDTV